VPYLRRRRGARIVNIVSMGGKIGVPHLTPGLPASSHRPGCRRRWQKSWESGIRVVWVPGPCGPDRTNARFKGDLGEYATAGGDAAGRVDGAARAARAINAT
jgi:hypothetical protein